MVLRVSSRASSAPTLSFESYPNLVYDREPVGAELAREDVSTDA